MNIRDYQYVITLAETGNYTTAAEKLFITQPSLSQRIKYIEETYGVRLFTKDRNGIHATQDGERFIRYASRILRSEEILREGFQEKTDSYRYAFRMGVSWMVDSVFLRELLPGLCRAYPEIRLDITESTSGEQQKLLLADRLDFAISYLPIQSDEISYRIILNDAFVFVPAAGSDIEKKIRKSYEKGAFIDPHLLDNIPFASGARESYLHRYLHELMEREQISPDIRHVIKSVPLLYEIAASGMASAILFRSFFPQQDKNVPYYYIKSSAGYNLPVAVCWRRDSRFAENGEEIIHTIRSISNDLNFWQEEE